MPIGYYENGIAVQKGKIPWNKGKKGLQSHTKEWKKQ
jgi:hypothetical protein